MTIPHAVDVTTAPLVAFVQIKFNREVEILVQLILDEGGDQPGFTLPERRRLSVCKTAYTSKLPKDILYGCDYHDLGLSFFLSVSVGTDNSPCSGFFIGALHLFEAVQLLQSCELL